MKERRQCFGLNDHGNGKKGNMFGGFVDSASFQSKFLARKWICGFPAPGARHASFLFLHDLQQNLLSGSQDENSFLVTPVSCWERAKSPETYCTFLQGHPFIFCIPINLMFNFPIQNLNLRLSSMLQTGFVWEACNFSVLSNSLPNCSSFMNTFLQWKSWIWYQRKTETFLYALSWTLLTIFTHPFVLPFQLISC